MPFAFAEEWLDSLHEQAHHGVEDDAVAEAEGFDRACVDFRVATMGAEGVLGVPEEAADEGEQEHGSEVDAYRGAEEDEVKDEHPRTMQSGDCGQKLLNHAGCKGQENNADGILDHFLGQASGMTRGSSGF